MEGGIDAGSGLPNGYYFYFDPAGTASTGVTTNTPDGSATAAEVTASGVTFAGFAQFVGGITAGQSYTFSADVNVSSLTGTANIYVSWRNSAGMEIGTAFSASTNAGDGYINLSVDAVAPPNAVDVQMAINFVDATVQSDNFCILAAAPPTVEGCDGNLLTNGTLDNNLDGWFTYFESSEATLYTATGGVNGTGAAEVGPVSQSFYGFGQAQPATPNEGYLARIEAKQTGVGTIQFILKFKDAGGGDIGAAQMADIISTNFQVYELAGLAPLGTVAVEVIIAGGGGGGATVDNFCLLSGYPLGGIGLCPSNLATDFGFENATEWFADPGWGCFGSSCSGENVENVGDPASGAKAVRVAGASPGVPDGSGYNGLSYAFTAVAGAEYSFTADLKRLGTTFYGQMHIYWQDAGGGAVDDELVSVADDGVYNSYSLTSIAPANTAQGILVFEMGNTGFLLVDNVCITEDISLPIHLLSFSGQPLAKTNQLSWITAREENTEMFYLERQSVNSGDWQTIGQVLAAGFSDDNITYTFEDPAPLTSSLYRLRTRDTDGSEQLSAAIHLQRVLADGSLLAYPNPFHSSLTIATKLASPADYYLLDGLGRTVLSGPVASGEQQTLIPTTNLPKGQYFLRIGERTVLITK